MRILMVTVIPIAVVIALYLSGQLYVTSIVNNAIKLMPGNKGKVSGSLIKAKTEVFSPTKGHFRVTAPGKLETELENGIETVRSSAGFVGSDYCIQDDEIAFHAGERSVNIAGDLALGIDSSTFATNNMGLNLSQNLMNFSTDSGPYSLAQKYSPAFTTQQDSQEVLVQKYLDKECDHVAQAIGGQVQQKISVSYGGGLYPGREISGTRSKRNKAFRTRIYCDPTNKRLFYLSVLGNDLRVESVQACRFLESLEILP